MDSVAQIDNLATQMYSSTDPAARQQAQHQLQTLIQADSNLNVLVTLLQQSCNIYTLTFLANGLVLYYNAKKKSFSSEACEEFVVTHCGQCIKRIFQTGMPRHVLTSMMICYSRLAKLSFQNEPVLAKAVEFALSLVSNGSHDEAHPSRSPSIPPSPSLGFTPTHTNSELSLYSLGLRLLDVIVNEMGKFDSSRCTTYMNFSTHRRCSMNFKDECLSSIFAASLHELEKVRAEDIGKGPGIANDATVYVAEVTELVKNCLTYDFMAITTDETEEMHSSQIPSAWKDAYLTNLPLQILWGQHASLPYPYCGVLMNGLQSLCGIRRTIFDSAEERIQYLDRTLEMLLEVTRIPDGRLKIPHYVTLYAEACVKLILPFGYRDLSQSSVFEHWVRSIQELSHEVFSIPFGCEGSHVTTTTLLSFWSRLSSSVRMVMSSDRKAHDLEIISPDLCLVFFRRCVNVNTANADRTGTKGSSQRSDATGTFVYDSGDFEENLDTLFAQSEAFANIVLLDPSATLSLIVDYLRQAVGPSILQSPTSVIWLFILTGNLVRQVLTNIDLECVDIFSDYLSYCVECANHRQTPSNGNGGGEDSLEITVETAILYFLNNIHSLVAGSHLAESLSQVVNNVFQSKVNLFQFILTTVGHNIMRGAGSDDGDERTASVIGSSIELIWQACNQVSKNTLQQLNFSLPPIVQLPLSHSRSTYKLRTNLYTVLWQLHNRGTYSRESLLQFLEPIAECMHNTATNTGPGYMSHSYAAGWLRDLRGVARAVNETGEVYTDFIEWFCEQSGIIHNLITGPLGSSPLVIISLLRLLLDLAPGGGKGLISMPRSSHSVEGLLLFKTICSLLQQVIERCITDENVRKISGTSPSPLDDGGPYGRQGEGSGGSVSADGVYNYMLKPLMLAMMILQRSIYSGFVPFGAMWFYNDDTFDKTLLGLLRMLPVFPSHLFREYRKVSDSVLRLLSTVVDEHVYPPLANLSTEELQAIIMFTVNACEDIDTSTTSMLNGLTFLNFIASLVKEAKALSFPLSHPVSVASTPPPSPQSLPMYCPYNTERAPLSIDRRRNGAPPSFSHTRDALARLLDPLSDLWHRLLHVAMNCIACQDRGLNSSCSILFTIYHNHPPLWYEFIEPFVETYPERKRQTLREALSQLMAGADSQDKLFSNSFSFRQTLREL